MSDVEPVRVSLNYSNLSKVARPTPQPAFTGFWSTIELRPDLFAPQKFTVGVVVQSANDRLHFKLLDSFKKFDCIYGDGFPHRSLKELMAYAYEALTKAAKQKVSIPDVIFESMCISISPPVFTSGDDREQTVERLFAEVVAMAPSEKKKAGKDFESIDTPRARRLVNEELRRIAGLDFERFVREDTQGLLIEGDGGEKHFLDLNLMTPHSCGSVTSVAYKTVTSVKINLLEASRDLTTYSRVREINDIGLFLLLPDPAAMDFKEYKRIEEVIDDYEWKLVRDGFRVVSLQEPAALAHEVYEWVRPNLQQGN
jgi:hypothetical protein